MSGVYINVPNVSASEVQVVPVIEGVDGESAYQTWLAAGNTGTEEDFLNSLKDADSARAIALANASQSTANAAITAANLAALQAAAAVEQIADFASDGIFSTIEKRQVRTNWQSIASEVPLNISQATTFSISYTAYNTAYTALCTYLNSGTTYTTGVPLWINDTYITQATSIDSVAFRAAFENYYTERTNLLNAIAKKAKDIADAATATANAAIAQSENALLSAQSAVSQAAAASQAINELNSSLFDSTGKIYTDKINPLSINTLLLTTGNAVTDLLITSEFTENYTNDPSKFNITAGVLSALQIESSPRSWTMGANLITSLVDANIYYIYARCPISGNTGTYYISTEKHLYNYETGYYTFVIGIINSVSNGYRLKQLTYGSAAIYGRSIKGGAIVNTLGKTIIDIDKGEFYGKFTFKSTSGTDTDVAAVNDTANAAQSTASSAATAAAGAQSSVDNLQIGGRNLVLNSARVITNNTSYSLSKNLNTLLGQQITIAYDYNYSNVSTGSDFNKKRIGCEIECVVNSTSIYLIGWIQLTASSSGLSGSGRAKFTVTIPLGTTNSIPSVNLYIQVVSGTVQLTNFKIEAGNKATDYTVAPEDVQANIDAANLAATNAASAAAAAQTSANGANAAIAEMASDGKLTAVEKQSYKVIWDGFVNEKSKYDTQADQYGVSRTAYDSAYTTLSNYITPLLADLTTTSNINSTDFTNNFKGYTGALVDLTNAIAAKAKTLAEAAQTQANTATTNAATAQTTANNAASAASLAQTDATNALGQLSNITSDNILSVAEKSGERQAWNVIYSEKSNLDSEATNFGITTEKNTYDNAFQSLATYLNNGNSWSSGVPAWLSDSALPTNTAIVGSTYRSNWEALYTARVNLRIAISTKAKTLADAAQTQANTATTNAATAQTTANNAASAASAAQTDASSAISKIYNITSDNILSASEKPSQRQAWDNILDEKSGIDTQATNFGITTEKTNYDNAFQALATYLNAGTTWTSGIPSWLTNANIGTDTSIVGSTYRTNWTSFYSSRTVLLNAIAAKAKTLADSAQTQANTATTNAATAQTTANNAASAASSAQTSANAANSAIADMSSDDVISPVEKPALKKEYDAIVSELSKNDSQADTFSVSRTTYDASYSSLNTYIGTNLNNLTTSWSLGTGGGATLRSKFKTYYDSRTDLLNAISAKAKALADAAQNSIDNLQIGGRNLVLNSSRVITSQTSYSLSKNLNTLLGQQITIAYDYNYSNVSTGSDYNKKRIGCEVECVVNSTSIYLIGWTQLTASSSGLSGSGRAKFTVTIPLGTTNSIPSVNLYIQVVSGTVQLSNFKIEVGNRATDYTVAPEDIDASIATKTQHFTGTANPSPPYVQGRDTWANGTDLYVCAVTRATGASYVAGDFVKATGYDNTQTIIDGGIVTSGTVQVAGDSSNILAGITGQNTGATATRFWAGATFANRDTAPFRVTQDGSLYATKATISGVITATSITAQSGNILNGCYIGNWLISSGGIINQTGDAYIIARQISGSYSNEGRIGTLVFPATSGAAGVSYFDCSISNSGPNFAIYTNAANGSAYDGLGIGNTYSYALFAKTGMVTGNDFLLNGRRTAKFSLANQYTTIDPSKYDTILINVTSGSESDLYFSSTNEYTIKDGKEIFIINYGATNNLRIKNVYNTGTDIVLDSGQAVVLRAIYKPSLTWWIQSFFDNN